MLPLAAILYIYVPLPKTGSHTDTTAGEEDSSPSPALHPWTREDHKVSGMRRSVHYVRRASSAAWARPINTLTMPVFLFVAGSRNSPSFTRPVTAATAPFCWEVVGRIMETGPRSALRNKVGSGMIRLV